jgi:hypothetical protein
MFVVWPHFFEGITRRPCPAFKGGKSGVAGQDELKKVGRDPLFWVNHTLAMRRANINRLIRKTWCTTKKVQPLITT